MKRILIIIIIAVLSLAGLQPPSVNGEAQTAEIGVFIDGMPVDFDVPPVIHADRVLVPFRAAAEAMGAKITWDEETQSITAESSGVTVQMQIGNPSAAVNHSQVTLDVPPMIIDSRTLIPLRFFGEAFGCEVSWNDERKEARLLTPPGSMTVAGYYAMDGNWKSLFGTDYPGTTQGNTDTLSTVSIGWYTLDREGTLAANSTSGWKKPEGWEKVLEAAKKYHLKTEMVINMVDGDRSLTALLDNPAAMSKAVDNILREAVLYQGVNLDFEGLGMTDTGEGLTAVQSKFTHFAGLLSERLKQQKLSLSLSLHAQNSAYKGYDYGALGKIADRIIIMAYDYGPKPEPVDLVEQAIEAAKETVPSAKLLLGISAASETAESLQSKIGLAKRHQLGGIALWRIGLLTDEDWAYLRQSVKPVK